jgi:hypothetical protein
MRKMIALALAVVTLTFGVPASMLAQTALSLRGSITGEAVDAGGRAVTGQRVELVQSGQVVQTTVTGSGGRFIFTNVPEGDYIVRVLVNGQPAGVRVSLAPGAAAANALIVTPSATAPSAFAGVPIAVLLIGAAVLVTTVVVALDDSDESS